MTTPASAPAPSSWRGDPERDFVIYQLIEMARHVLDEYFSDDERVAEYQAPGRRTKGRKWWGVVSANCPGRYCRNERIHLGLL
jgi:hypothetical protein